jgi:hypothetical protein
MEHLQGLAAARLWSSLEQMCRLCLKMGNTDPAQTTLLLGRALIKLR